MIELLDLLDEVNKILKSKKKKELISSSAEPKKEIAQNYLFFSKRPNFELLKLDESRNVSDFGKTISTIFSPFISNIRRHGIVKKYNGKNISFYSSFLAIMLKTYKNDSEENIFIQNNSSSNNIFVDKINFVECVEKMISDAIMLVKNMSLNYKKLGWKKQEILKSLNEKECDKTIVALFSKIYNVNIFLCHFLNDKMMAIYHDDIFNKYKPSIFLSFHENTYEPLSYNNNFVWDYSHEPYLKLMTVDHQNIVVINESIVLGEKKFKHISISDYSFDIPSSSETETISETVTIDLKKMSMVELKKLANSKGIPLKNEIILNGRKKYKAKLKVDLIIELQNILMKKNPTDDITFKK